MKNKKIGFKYKNKRVKINLKVCEGFEKIIGLMFTRKEKARALLFEFPHLTKIPIHSFFVFFPFIAIWLDDKNKIVEIKIIKPFKFAVLPKKQFNQLIEVPINGNYSKIVKLLVGD